MKGNSAEEVAARVLSQSSLSGLLVLFEKNYLKQKKFKTWIV